MPLFYNILDFLSSIFPDYQPYMDFARNLRKIFNFQSSYCVLQYRRTKTPRKRGDSLGLISGRHWFLITSLAATIPTDGCSAGNYARQNHHICLLYKIESEASS